MILNVSCYRAITNVVRCMPSALIPSIKPGVTNFSNPICLFYIRKCLFLLSPEFQCLFMIAVHGIFNILLYIHISNISKHLWYCASKVHISHASNSVDNTYVCAVCNFVDTFLFWVREYRFHFVKMFVLPLQSFVLFLLCLYSRSLWLHLYTWTFQLV